MMSCSALEPLAVTRVRAPVLDEACTVTPVLVDGFNRNVLPGVGPEQRIGEGVRDKLKTQVGIPIIHHSSFIKISAVWSFLHPMPAQQSL